ncbi:MAG: hypothetical protein L3J34_08045 [Flavobacteriaceae bacterium]|nr:hypothetical protein [Flavobacteriaceae bacterium]
MELLELWILICKKKEIPGLYFFVGGRPLDVKLEDSASYHTPDFFIDESGMKLGVKAKVNFTLDYMQTAKK